MVSVDAPKDTIVKRTRRQVATVVLTARLIIPGLYKQNFGFSWLNSPRKGSFPCLNGIRHLLMRLVLVGISRLSDFSDGT